MFKKQPKFITSKDIINNIDKLIKVKNVVKNNDTLIVNEIKNDNIVKNEEIKTEPIVKKRKKELRVVDIFNSDSWIL
jgi:hypothetical protein